MPTTTLTGLHDERNRSEQTRDLGGECPAEGGDLIGGVNHVLAIGVSSYSHPLRTLKNCVKDVEDITRVLVSNYDFEDDHVRILRDKEATRRNIIEALDTYGPGHPVSLTENDNLIVFFAGHGELRNGIGAWIPVDARGFPDYLHVSTIWDFLAPIKARHVLIIADACFAGSFFSPTRMTDPTKLAEQHPSRYVLAAGRDTPVSDGEAGENSPFAAALNRRLNTAEGSIGAVMLGEQVREDVVRVTMGAQEPRHGELTISGNKHGQFFFHGKTERTADRFIDVFFEHGGDLLPLDHMLRRHVQEDFDKYHKRFTLWSDDQKERSRRLNTEKNLARWGLDVAVLKKNLQILDFYRGEVDNEYTPDLGSALEAFQQYHSMAHVDGYFGELTYKEMVNELIKKGLASMPRGRPAAKPQTFSRT